MRNKVVLRLAAALLAAALCIPAFALTTFAYDGGDTAETTGGLEPDTTDSMETSEDTELTDGELASLLSALAGVQVSVTEDGIQITGTGTEDTESHQAGTVTTGGGNLNVRTGAGLDNDAFTQLPNGATVEVIGTEGDWIKILLPERVGYVYSDYLTVTDAETAGASGDGLSLSISEEELSSLLELFMGGLTDGSGAALTPDGNLTLIDDIGSSTESGKQFITVETKSGNVFYLIIDRDDKGEETVHFLNQVDEADLLALMEDGQTAAPSVSYTDTVEQPITEPEPVEPDVPEEPVEEKSSGAGAILAVLLILAACGGAAAYFLVLKPKQGKKVPSDLDDLDLEDEEEYLNEDETEETE